MSESEYSDDGLDDCPLCMEEFDETDKHFKPCPCAYQICRFCWNHINADLNGLCPACRRPYSDETLEFKPLTNEEIAKIKLAKKKKQRAVKEQEQVQRKQLANVRVVQKTLVYVLGLSPKVATEDVLRQHDYFGQYGKITKIVINRRGPQALPMTATNNGVYITFSRKEDAANAIDAVDGSVCDGRMIRATFGTTKYCSFFLKGQPCQNPGCQYLHEPGEEADSFQKDEKATRHLAAKTTAFPVLGGAKKDEREESALPATASWAKPARQISDYVGVSAGSAVATTNGSESNVLGSNYGGTSPLYIEESSGASISDDIPTFNEVNFSPASTEKGAYSSAISTALPPGLIPILSPDSFTVPSEDFELPFINPDSNSSVDANLSVPISPEPAPSLAELGYCLVMKYNGLLDPFDNFDLSARMTESLPQSRFERMFGSESPGAPIEFNNRSPPFSPSQSFPSPSESQEPARWPQQDSYRRGQSYPQQQATRATPTMHQQYMDKVQHTYGPGAGGQRSPPDDYISQLIRNNQIRPASSPIDPPFADPAIMSARGPRFGSAQINAQGSAQFGGDAAYFSEPRGFAGFERTATAAWPTTAGHIGHAEETDVGSRDSEEYTTFFSPASVSVSSSVLSVGSGGAAVGGGGVSRTEEVTVIAAESLLKVPGLEVKRFIVGYSPTTRRAAVKHNSTELQEVNAPAASRSESLNPSPKNGSTIMSPANKRRSSPNAPTQSDVVVPLVSNRNAQSTVVGISAPVVRDKKEERTPALPKKNASAPDKQPSYPSPPRHTKLSATIPDPKLQQLVKKSSKKKSSNTPVPALSPPLVPNPFPSKIADLSTLSQNLDHLTQSLEALNNAEPCPNGTSEFLERAIASLSETSSTLLAGAVGGKSGIIPDAGVLEGIKESMERVVEQVVRLEGWSESMKSERSLEDEWMREVKEIHRRAAHDMTAHSPLKKKRRSKRTFKDIGELERELSAARSEEKMLYQQFVDVCARNKSERVMVGR